MHDAAGALAGVVTGALRGVAGLSFVSDGAPIQAGDAHAVVEIGPEGDWGHKSGAGAEVRFAVIVRCRGERPERARDLLGAVREAVSALAPEVGPSTSSGQSWRLISLAMMRSRVMRESGPGWAGVVDYRARLLAAA